MLFGAKTEKLGAVCTDTHGHASEPTASGNHRDGDGDQATPQADASNTQTEPCEDRDGTPKPADAGQDESDNKNGIPGPSNNKRKGHGRLGAKHYTGCTPIDIEHELLKVGANCPTCTKGSLYALAAPKVLVRITGGAPLSGTIYRAQQLRCNLCGKVYAAEMPDDVGEEKYDASARSMLGMLKYGTGMPFERLGRLQSNLGIPMPPATQWELVAQLGAQARPIYAALCRRAAQCGLLHNDDTVMRILEAMAAKRALQAGKAAPTAKGDGPEQEQDQLRAIFTTAIVAVDADHIIPIFVTGHRHAGENLEQILKERSMDLGPPVQMCDSLSRNIPKSMATILANCLTHGRRKFTDVVEKFPEEVRYVLERMAEVYKNDDFTKQEKMTPSERLAYHQKHSAVVMGRLKKWMIEKLHRKECEENGGLGTAIAYMRRHWKKLVKFLVVAGAPLDNNVCERVLKKCILHRKNSYFYKTYNGARVGDTLMTVIHTAELAGKNAHEYLTAIARHSDDVASRPDAWFPWNYEQTLAALAAN